MDTKKNEGAAPFPDNQKTNRYLRVRWLLYFRKQGRKAKHDWPSFLHHNLVCDIINQVIKLSWH